MSSRALLPQQERYRELAQDKEKFPASHIALAFELKGDVDTAKLKEAFTLVWHASEASRFRFDPATGLQWKATEAISPEFTILQAEEGVSRAMLTKDFEQPFDLLRQAPLRLRVIQVKPDRYLFSIVAHHLPLDGWSVARMLEKSCDVYNALRGKEAIPPINWEPFSGYIDKFESLDQAKSLAFWKERKFLPAVFTGLGDKTGGHRAIYILNRKYHTLIRDTAKKNQVTPFLFLMLCFMRAIGKVLKKTDFVIAAPIAVRDWPKAEFVIGNCVNLMPLNVRLSANNDLKKDLRALRDEFLDSVGHGSVPIQQIQAMHAGDLTQVHFNFEPKVDEPELSGSEIDFYPFPVSQVEKPVIINVNDTKNTYYVELDYQFQALELVQALTIFTETERVIRNFSALDTPKV